MNREKCHCGAIIRAAIQKEMGKYCYAYAKRERQS
jgi:hypothetical protein